jgi:hypothetical protein
VTPPPLPGMNEADLIAKVGAAVVRGMRQGSQLPSWPNTRESLLELLSVLDDWCMRADQTAEYARALAHQRLNNVAHPDEYEKIMSYFGPISNVSRGYITVVQRDTRDLMYGPIPPLSRFSSRRKRKAARRGLRTILLAYCPDVLLQFEKAMSDRVDWVIEHRDDFNNCFNDMQNTEEVLETLKYMRATQASLLDAALRLREFIVECFPLAPSPHKGHEDV